MGGGASKQPKAAGTQQAQQQSNEGDCCPNCKPRFDQLRAELAAMKKEKSHAISELQELKVEHERLESLYKNMRESKKDLGETNGGGVKML